MLGKKAKILSITSCSSGDFLFVFGLGSDGACYIWNSEKCEWLLHKAISPQEQAERDGKNT